MAEQHETCRIVITVYALFVGFSGFMRAEYDVQQEKQKAESILTRVWYIASPTNSYWGL